MTGMTPERLADIRGRITGATEGPWAPWLDQDGQPHMGGMLMVGNAAAVIPEGETWIEGVDVNPIAHTYTPEDRRFIAHARADVPDLIDEVERLRAGIEDATQALWEAWVESGDLSMIERTRHDLEDLLNPTEQAGGAS